MLPTGFSIYRSSAGSGKTRTLARTYLLLALSFRADYFKHILAVTFTNKSTQEMKDRILAYLDDFARGRPNELAVELQQELKLDPSTFQQYAQEAQAAILHQYDRFSISTIDAFFQKVIRSFTREAGLVGDYRLEVEQETVLEEVIDNLVDELGPNRELTEWVVEFARENLENDRAWDVRTSLLEFAQEIFREEFKVIEGDFMRTTADRGYFKEVQEMLVRERNNFRDTGRELAREALQRISEEGWTATDFYFGKGSGLFTVFESWLNLKQVRSLKDVAGLAQPGSRVRTTFTDAGNWPAKTSKDKARIIAVAEADLLPRLVAILDLYDSSFTTALTAELLLQNLYVFGLMADISRKLAEYKEENNMMLLADAPKFLQGVIQDSDTPYVYEKVGSFYRNYLIDEFQDTSFMQWKNFLPLVANGLDQGNASIVVGDVKQAIYRWRGGDLRLLQHTVEHHIGSLRTTSQALATNYRSGSHIVNFNNIIFEQAAAIASSDTNNPLAEDAYRDVRQRVARPEEGFVQVKFLKEDPETTWKDTALELIPAHLENLQAQGVALRDIAILVRRNDEGQKIVASLLQYRNDGRAKPGFAYDVVSNESLWLDGAPTVNLLLAAMHYLLNPDDAIARAQLSYEFSRQQATQRPLEEVFAVSNHAFFEHLLPPAFAQEKGMLKKLPLIELTETLIRIFRLGEQRGELAYLLAFQNLVLEFYNRERNDLGAFLEWWQDNKHKKSVQLPGDIDAVQILTVHKSKGLQFKYVILPFCAWSLDHDNYQAPTLWVKTEVSPFDRIGYAPVKYSSALQHSFFADDYTEERTRVYVDNLNLLYVALTRAERGLIVTAPHRETRGGKKSVGGLLHTCIASGFSEEAGWNAAHDELTLGTIQPSDAGRVPAASGQLDGYPAYAWRDRLAIRRSGAFYFDETARLKQAGITYGLHMHAILSRIRYAEDAEDVIGKMLIDGLVSSDERNNLIPAFEELMRIPRIALWFDKQWEVRTESPILMPSGTEARIDRLLIRDRHAIVIDFKTGSPTRHDNNQVHEYMKVLLQMNFTRVEGYLLYLRTNEVVQVPHGKPGNTAKNKNRSQLDLGF